jgi:hypothetical protein
VFYSFDSERNVVQRTNASGRIIAFPVECRVRAEEFPNHAEVVRALLIKFLKACRLDDPSLSSLPLPELVHKESASRDQIVTTVGILL